MMSSFLFPAALRIAGLGAVLGILSDCSNLEVDVRLNPLYVTLVQGESATIVIAGCFDDDEQAQECDYELRSEPAGVTAFIDLSLRSQSTRSVAQMTLSAGIDTPPGRYAVPVDATINNTDAGVGFLRLHVLPEGPPVVTAPATSVSVGSSHSMALLSDGSLAAWGLNIDGQLGVGNEYLNNAPEPVLGLTEVVASVDLNFRHSVAVLADGSAWSWGDNFSDQLGGGVARSLPGAFQVPVNVTAAAAGNDFTLVLDTTGRVWAAGRNEHGQLGLPGSEGVALPALIGGLIGVQDVAAGRHHSLALLANGTVWAWGRNDDGQLGDGTTTTRSTPVPVWDLADVQAIEARAEHSLALLNDGSVWAWGRNRSGQLGNGTLTNASVPVPVQNLIDVQAIAAGGLHSLALRADGTVWTWGSNLNRQPSLIPEQVLNLTEAVAIAAGIGHSLAVLDCGAVWGWGLNNSGELGDGTRTDRGLPVPVNGIGEAFPCDRVALSIWNSGLGEGAVGSDTGNLVTDDVGGYAFEIADRNTLITLTAVAEAGSVFNRWTGDCSGTNPQITVIMDVGKTCAADFSKTVPGPFLLSVRATSGYVQSSGGGLYGPDNIDCGGTCDAIFATGTLVDLTAIPASEFIQWTGDCSGTDPNTQLLMDDHKFCGAEFAGPDFSLTVIPDLSVGAVVVQDPPGSVMNCGTVCSDTFSPGTTVILGVDTGPLPDWAGCDSEPAGECLVVMTSNRTVNAADP